MKIFFFLFFGIYCVLTSLMAENDITLRDRCIDLLNKKGQGTDSLPSDDLLGQYYLELMKDLLLGNETLVSRKRLTGLQNCMQDVEQNQIPGDFIETGVWRGGSVIFMKAFLTANDDKLRKVWAADSFEGFPFTDRPKETKINNKFYPFVVVPLETVMDNFRKYKLLDNQVLFLKGFFNETLPTAPIETLAILRLDGDLYESTMDALIHLYPKLSIGGYIIIDDYGHFPDCAAAVQDYRKAHNINEEFFWEDYTAIHWKKIK